jgi:ParB family chromosome partitioning protein
MAERKRGLGRGLSALIGDGAKKALSEPAPVTPSDAPAPTAQTQSASAPTSGGASASGFQHLGVDQLVPGKFQPRQNFDDGELQALAGSLAKSGVLQPLLVRPLKNPSSGGAAYEIIAGERRWRAAQLAKLHSVPAIVQVLDDSEALEVGIIENVQRADLNPIEEAEGYQRLMKEFAYTQAELADTIGKSRSHIANMLRLTGATQIVRQSLIDGLLSTGHARALLGHAEADKLAKKVIAEGLSVRAVEALVASAKISKPKAARKARSVEKDADTRALEKTLSDRLGLSVAIDDKGDNLGGRVTIEYKTLDQLDAVIVRLTSGSH